MTKYFHKHFVNGSPHGKHYLQFILNNNLKISTGELLTFVKELFSYNTDNHKSSL